MDQFVLLLHQKYFPKFQLGDIGHKLLEVFFNSELWNTQELANILKIYPDYFQLLLRSEILSNRKSSWGNEEAVEQEPTEEEKKSGKKAKAKELPEEEKITALMGKNLTRNAIIRLRGMETNGDFKLLKENSTAPVVLVLDRYFTRSMQLENFSAEKWLSFPELNFLTGWVFDWFENVILSERGVPSFLQPLIAEYWPKTVLAGLISYNLGMKLKNFALGRYSLVASFLPLLGKLFMGLMIGPDWEKFNTNTKNDSFWNKNPHLLEIKELQQFKITHGEIASLFAFQFAPFRDIGLSLLHINHPYFLKSDKNNQSILALLVSVAWQLANNAPLTIYQKKGLASCKLSEADLNTSVQNAQKLKNSF